MMFFLSIFRSKWFWGISLAFLILFISFCCTFPVRTPDANEKIEQFIQQNAPGSEIELFNGENFSGWEIHGFGKWRIEDGVLSAQRGIGYLSTQYSEFNDFILSLQIRISAKGNSGVFFRSRRPGLGFRPWPVGYEAQVDNHDSKNLTGSLYDRVSAEREYTKDNEWFDMWISAIGANIKIQVNGEIVVDATDSSFSKGFIALQAHDFFSCVEYRNIKLRIPD